MKRELSKSVKKDLNQKIEDSNRIRKEFQDLMANKEANKEKIINLIDENPWVIEYPELADTYSL